MVYTKEVKKIFFTIELFLISLIVLFAAFLFFIFTRKEKAESLADVPVVVDTAELYCGITVTEPAIGSHVSFPLTVSGYISGCGWESYSGYAARLKLFDSEKRQIGRQYLVHSSEASTSPVSSQFHFAISDAPALPGSELFFEFTSFSSEEHVFTFPVMVASLMEDAEKI